MKVGDIIRLRSFEHYFDNGEVRGRIGQKADKEYQFVAVMLGVERRDGSDPLDVNAALQSLGWTPPPDEDEAAPPPGAPEEGE